MAISRAQSKKQISKSPARRKKIRKVMGEFSEGKLKSGSGKKVKNRRQAIAIALSEATKPRRRK